MKSFTGCWYCFLPAALLLAGGQSAGAGRGAAEMKINPPEGSYFNGYQQTESTGA